MLRPVTRLSLALAAVCAVAFLAPPALAQAPGINLNWDDCTLGSPASNKTNACNSNFGAPSKLIISVNPGGTALDNVNGAQGVVDIQMDTGDIPDWWRIDNGACRAGALIADVAVGSGNAPFSCPEPWASAGGGQAGGANFALNVSGHGTDWGRITWIVAIPGLTTLDPNGAPDWYIIALNITNANTLTCNTGCTTPACLVANEVRLTKPAQTPGGDVFIYDADVNQHVTWQGPLSVNTCPGTTPVRNTTWGQVKHLYR